jgi:hypothetical protein
MNARPIHVWLLCLLFLMAAAPATNPTTMPTTRPAPDLSSPRAAAMSMRLALAAGDVEALGQVIHAGDEPHRRLAEAYAAVIISGQRLSDAMMRQFGTASSSILTDEDLAAIDAAPLRVSGNSATLRLPGRGDKPLVFRRDDAGRWRADLLTFANVTDAGDVASQCEMQINLATALSELAAEISTGRYRTAADAKAAVQDRVHGAIAKSMRAATSHRTTEPATLPSSP